MSSKVDVSTRAFPFLDELKIQKPHLNALICEIQGELKIDTKELYKINNQWYNNY